MRAGCSPPVPAAPDLLLTHARLVAPGRVIEDSWVAVLAGRVSRLGTGTPPWGDDAPQTVDCGGDWLAPGFIDVHAHGGGGGDVMSPDAEARRRVREVHARHGTTAMLASTVSAPRAALYDAVCRLAADAAASRTEDDGVTAADAPTRPAARLVGIHLEGPFVSARRKGAHDQAHLRRPDGEELASLLSAGAGHVRTITLAPELPGGLELVSRAVAAGLVVALGHTDADADVLRQAVDRGASALTHTYNCMRPLHHREPGGVGLGMDDERLICELILDGVHVGPVAARALVRAAGTERVCLVTDAMAATGMPDGTYEVGGSRVEVVGGRVVLQGTDVLAASTLTMGDAVRNAVRMLGLDVPTAVAMATTVPARLLDSDEVGAVAVGRRADLVRLRADASLATTYVGGREVTACDPSTAPESVP
ncbi:MAG: N-acetylglucosamine-6-phosphate deacetylase [Actinomycetota bacterium]|nr:N-acetylglucosamine-6-phosphate deacetylase [Actinomycetota bacterium]